MKNQPLLIGQGYRVATWLVILAVAGALAMAFYVIIENSNLSPLQEFSVSLLSGLALSGITYLASNYFIRTFQDAEMGLHISREFGKAVATNKAHIIGNTPWGELIDEATTIDFIVQAWDGWFDLAEVKEALPEFFKRNGKFNFYIYHYDKTKVLGLHESWKQRRDLPGEDGIRKELSGSITKLYHIFEGKGAKEGKKAEVTIRLLKQVNWYCAIRFNPGPLLLSPYAHCHREVNMAPVSLIDTRIHSKIARWFQNEIDFLIEKDNSNSEPIDRDDFNRWLKANKVPS